MLFCRVGLASPRIGPRTRYRAAILGCVGNNDDLRAARYAPSFAKDVEFDLTKPTGEGIPVGTPLKAALDATPKRSTVILTSTDNKPWTEEGFRSSWRKACSAAGISGLTFHDLRGTAVTRLALAGCSQAEIATITGHSLRDVGAILDAHYLHRDPALAESAIRKLEKGTETPNKAPNHRRWSNATAPKVLQNQLAGGLGFEPRLAESESAVLPLDDPPPVGGTTQAWVCVTHDLTSTPGRDWVGPDRPAAPAIGPGAAI